MGELLISKPNIEIHDRWDTLVVIETNEQGPRGSQGEQGVRGVPGPAGDMVFFVAGVDLPGHVVVTSSPTGELIPADSSLDQHQYVVGITTDAALAGAAARLQSRGPMEHLGWSFIANTPVFLGSDGALTQSIPATSLFSKVIGVALSPTSISIDIQPAIFFN